MEGTIKLNGEIYSYSMFMKFCGVVKQYNTLWSQLTLIKHLHYTADLALNLIQLSRRTKNFLTSLLFWVYGACVQQKHPGYPADKNITFLWQWLCLRALYYCYWTNQPVVRRFVITSHGTFFLLKYDTYYSLFISSDIRIWFSICHKSIKRIADNIGVMILCTIHQPFFKVFSEFNHVTLLSQGRTVYSGDISNIIWYFESKGYPCPVNLNPTDHLLHITNSEFTCLEKLEILFSSWNKHKKIRSWIAL